MLTLLRPIAPVLLATALLAQPALAAGLFAHVAWEHAAEAAHAARHAHAAGEHHHEADGDGPAAPGHSHELRPVGAAEPARLTRPDRDPSPAACTPVTLPAAMVLRERPEPAPARPFTGPPDPQRHPVLRL